MRRRTFISIGWAVVALVAVGLVLGLRTGGKPVVPSSQPAFPLETIRLVEIETGTASEDAVVRIDPDSQPGLAAMVDAERGSGFPAFLRVLDDSAIDASTRRLKVQCVRAAILTLPRAPLAGSKSYYLTLAAKEGGGFSSDIVLATGSADKPVSVKTRDEAFIVLADSDLLGSPRLIVENVSVDGRPIPLATHIFGKTSSLSDSLGGLKLESVVAVRRGEEVARAIVFDLEFRSAPIELRAVSLRDGKWLLSKP